MAEKYLTRIVRISWRKISLPDSVTALILENVEPSGSLGGIPLYALTPWTINELLSKAGSREDATALKRLREKAEDTGRAYLAIATVSPAQ